MTTLMGLYGTLQYKICMFSSALNTASIKATNIRELLRTCVLTQLIGSDTSYTEHRYIVFAYQVSAQNSAMAWLHKKAFFSLL